MRDQILSHLQDSPWDTVSMFLYGGLLMPTIGIMASRNFRPDVSLSSTISNTDTVILRLSH